MMKTAAVIGGDGRALYAAKELCAAGINCRIYGLEKEGKGLCAGIAGGCSAPYLLAETLEGAEAALFPIPVTRDGEHIETPLSGAAITVGEAAELLPAGCEVYGGRLPEALKKSGRWTDLLESEEFAALNALPTAESAIALAALRYGGVLEGSACAVVGYGKIGRVLTKKLLALGAAVTVYARRAESRAAAFEAGARAKGPEELTRGASAAQMIFNTAPAQLLTEEGARGLDEAAVYIELASPPYGATPGARALLGERLLQAPGLPGRYSPAYAGACIARMIRGV